MKYRRDRTGRPLEPGPVADLNTALDYPQGIRLLTATTLPVPASRGQPARVVDSVIPLVNDCKPNLKRRAIGRIHPKKISMFDHKIKK